MLQSNVPKAALKRLPVYLHYLKDCSVKHGENVSATAIAKALGFGDVQVRKDLGAVSGAGKPKTGYAVSELIERLETFLGYNNKSNAVVVGAGKLGKALLDYDGFEEYGVNLAAAFDADERKIGKTETGKNIFPMSGFKDFCQSTDVKIGIITVPAVSAQLVCDTMVESKIPAIWNFAPKPLKAPENVIIHNENMALSLAVLLGHLNEQNKI